MPTAVSSTGTEHRLTPPLSVALVGGLGAGDCVRVAGIVYGLRDATPPESSRGARPSAHGN